MIISLFFIYDLCHLTLVQACVLRISDHSLLRVCYAHIAQVRETRASRGKSIASAPGGKEHPGGKKCPGKAPVPAGPLSLVHLSRDGEHRGRTRPAPEFFHWTTRSVSRHLGQLCCPHGTARTSQLKQQTPLHPALGAGSLGSGARVVRLLTRSLFLAGRWAGPAASSHEQRQKLISS